jgi:hypothetical protein
LVNLFVDQEQARSAFVTITSQRIVEPSTDGSIWKQILEDFHADLGGELHEITWHFLPVLVGVTELKEGRFPLDQLVTETAVRDGFTPSSKNALLSMGAADGEIAPGMVHGRPGTGGSVVELGSVAAVFKGQELHSLGTALDMVGQASPPRLRRRRRVQERLGWWRLGDGQRRRGREGGSHAGSKRRSQHWRWGWGWWVVHDGGGGSGGDDGGAFWARSRWNAATWPVEKRFVAHRAEPGKTMVKPRWARVVALSRGETVRTVMWVVLVLVLVLMLVLVLEFGLEEFHTTVLNVRDVQKQRPIHAAMAYIHRLAPSDLS